MQDRQRRSRSKEPVRVQVNGRAARVPFCDIIGIMASGNRNQEKPPRKRLGRRMGEHLDAIGSLGNTAMNRPRELPRHAEGMLRRWFKNVWAVRGGGLYAVGFAVTFLYLEIVEILTDDLPALFTINILSSEIFELILSFIVDTFLNFLTALIWPAFVVTFAAPWGAIGLGIAFVAFNQFLKAPVERWLESDEPTAPERPE